MNGEWPPMKKLEEDILKEVIENPGLRTADRIAGIFCEGNLASADVAITNLRNEGLLKPRGSHLLPTPFALGKGERVRPTSVSMTQTQRHEHARKQKVYAAAYAAERHAGMTLDQLHIACEAKERGLGSTTAFRKYLGAAVELGLVDLRRSGKRKIYVRTTAPIPPGPWRARMKFDEMTSPGAGGAPISQPPRSQAPWRPTKAAPPVKPTKAAAPPDLKLVKTEATAPPVSEKVAMRRRTMNRKVTDRRKRLLEILRGAGRDGAQISEIHSIIGNAVGQQTLRNDLADMVVEGSVTRVKVNHSKVVWYIAGQQPDAQPEPRAEVVELSEVDQEITGAATRDILLDAIEEANADEDAAYAVTFVRSPRVMHALNVLAETGLFGETVADVANELIREGVRRHAGWWNRPVGGVAT